MKKMLLMVSMFLLMLNMGIAQTNKEQPPGSGEADDPYIISTLGHLSWLTQNYEAWNKVYVQVNDINAAETATWDYEDDNGDSDRFNDPNDLTMEGANEGWLPVELFNGSYDGQGHVIDSLMIAKSMDGIGFFSTISGATVKNLGLTNVDVRGSEVVGVLAGYCEGNTVKNCFTTGKLTTTNSASPDAEAKYKFGGFFARINTNISEISNCYSDVDIYANPNAYYAAGFVGNIKGLPAGTIENCYAMGDIINGGQSCAGFVGKNEAEEFIISKCYSTGNVNARERSGGFVAYNKNGAVIENCYSLGDVIRTGGSEVDLGGFCGYNNGSTINNSYSIGSVLYGDTVITDKGFIGEDNGGTTTACFFDSTVSNQDSCVGAIALSTEEMQTDTTFINAGWDFNNVWVINGTDYPKLKDILSDIEVDNSLALKPAEYKLNQNYPNPFNPSTVIGFTLPVNDNVRLTVYNMLGQKVAELINGKMTSGYHEVKFNAHNLSSGVYIYRIKSGDFVSVKKMMLLK